MADKPLILAPGGQPVMAKDNGDGTFSVKTQVGNPGGLPVKAVVLFPGGAPVRVLDNGDGTFTLTSSNG